MEEVRITSSTGGQKGSKEARYDLIPVEALRWVAIVFGRGAKKYDEHNWRKGYNWSLSYAAMQRHANSFWDTQDPDYDPETAVPHLASVVFHAMALIVFMLNPRYQKFDDRWREDGPGEPVPK